MDEIRTISMVQLNNKPPFPSVRPRIPPKSSLFNPPHTSPLWEVGPTTTILHQVFPSLQPSWRLLTNCTLPASLHVISANISTIRPITGSRSEHENVSSTFQSGSCHHFIISIVIISILLVECWGRLVFTSHRRWMSWPWLLGPLPRNQQLLRTLFGVDHMRDTCWGTGWLMDDIWYAKPCETCMLHYNATKCNYLTSPPLTSQHHRCSYRYTVIQPKTTTKELVTLTYIWQVLLPSVTVALSIPHR